MQSCFVATPVVNELWLDLTCPYIMGLNAYCQTKQQLKNSGRYVQTSQKMFCIAKFSWLSIFQKRQWAKTAQTTDAQAVFAGNQPCWSVPVFLAGEANLAEGEGDSTPSATIGHLCNVGVTHNPSRCKAGKDMFKEVGKENEISGTAWR